MALDKNRMADNIVECIGGLKGSDEQKSLAREYIEAFCCGIIKEIQENAVVHTVDSEGDTCDDGTVE